MLPLVSGFGHNRRKQTRTLNKLVACLRRSCAHHPRANNCQSLNRTFVET